MTVASILVCFSAFATVDVVRAFSSLQPLQRIASRASSFAQQPQPSPLSPYNPHICSTTDAYLESLSHFALQAQTTATSSTQAYLESLSQFLVANEEGGAGEAATTTSAFSYGNGFSEESIRQAEAAVEGATTESAYATTFSSSDSTVIAETTTTTTMPHDEPISTPFSTITTTTNPPPMTEMDLQAQQALAEVGESSAATIEVDVDLLAQQFSSQTAETAMEGVVSGVIDPASQYHPPYPAPEESWSGNGFMAEPATNTAAVSNNINDALGGGGGSDIFSPPPSVLADDATTTAATTLLPEPTTSGTSAVDSTLGNADSAASTLLTPPSEANDLLNQLSDLSYGSMTAEDKDATAMATTAKSSAAIGQGINDAMSQQLHSLQSALQDAAHSAGQGLQSGLQATGNVVNKGVQVAGQGIADVWSNTNDKIAQGAVATQTSLSESAHSNLQAAGDLSLSKVGTMVVSGLKSLGNLLVMLLNALVEAVTNDNSNLSELVQRVQTSVQGVVDGAATQVSNTLHGLGQVSLKDASTTLIQVLTLVVRVMFTILSKVVQLATGQGLEVWITQAQESLQHQADQLLSAAATAASNVSHASFAELTRLLGQFLEQAGQAMISTVSAAVETVGAVSQTL